VAASPASGDPRPADIAIIGGGVVGCALARRFTLDGASVVLVEKAPDILEGASKGNSALLHTGFDAPPDSTELACVRDGYAEYLAIRERLNLPLLETGAWVVAWNEEEAARLDSIVAQAHANGVGDVTRVDRDTLLRAVPGLARDALGAVTVPGEHAIDPWSAPLAYLLQAVANGARAVFGTEVTGGLLHDGMWSLRTTAGTIAARTVINAAGLFGDLIDQRVLGESDFEIRPRKGQFLVLDKAARRHLSTIVLPVPTERTKGVLLAPTAFGNVLVGPTAEDQQDRTDASVDRQTLQSLAAHAVRVIPALAGVPVTATYAGLRPASEAKEYRIRARPERRWITVGGIRSTGLTAALGIARHVADLYRAFGPAHAPLEEPVWPRVPNLAEHLPRDWQAAGNGGIVCHCELVTEREIAAALAAPLPAAELSGLKRRTRAGMGRCQGFYCTARLARMLKGRLAEPVDLGVAHG
jgi:glycerol-3-phosphate dehydrogenase